MSFIQQETFVCFDCETTGLDPENDLIVEIAIAKFTFNGVIASEEDLVDPRIPIPPPTIEIHHITDAMVAGKPTIGEILPKYLEIIDGHTLVGHFIPFDITAVCKAAERSGIRCNISSLPFIDTLRLARLYGESPSNSLETLRKHFNIEAREAHRAMSDVLVNIEVFKHLTTKFKSAKEILKRLEKPVLLKAMPLGKHKGRLFNEIPISYLDWARRQNFDQDLLYSIRSELKKRKHGSQFSQASNPFSAL